MGIINYASSQHHLHEIKKQTFEAHSVRKCASAIFVQCPSDISLMRYAVNRAIYGFRRAKWHEYNIAKAKGFYIAFFLKISRYRRGFSKENIAVRPVSQYH